MPIQAIAYTSVAIPGLHIDDVERMTRKSESFNRRAGVTGVLLYDGSRFLQYIEGPEDGLEVVFSRILSAELHTNLVALGRGSCTRRNFHYWSMRRFSVDSSDLDRVAEQDWSRFVLRPLLDEGSRHYGIEALAMMLLPYLKS